MLKELFDAVSAKAVEARGPHLADLPGGKLGVLTPDDWQIMDAVPDPRNHFVDTLDDILAARTKYGGMHSTIWVSAEAVTLVLDDQMGALRQNTVTMPLRLSDQFTSLQSLPKSFNQRQLIHFLQVDLADCLEEGIIPLFQRLTWSRSGLTATGSTHGNESLGRQVEAKVTESATIPETLRVMPRVFGQLACTFEVRVNVFLDTDNEHIRLTVLPDQLENALHYAVAWVVSQLANDDVEIFRGTP